MRIVVLSVFLSGAVWTACQSGTPSSPSEPPAEPDTAQEGPGIVKASAGGDRTAAESAARIGLKELSSPSVARKAFSAQYPSLVKSAYPTVTRDALASKIAAIATREKTLEKKQRDPVGSVGLESVQQMLSLSRDGVKASEDSLKSRDYTLRVDKKRGEILFSNTRADLFKVGKKPKETITAAELEKRITGVHGKNRTLLADLGLRPEDSIVPDKPTPLIGQGFTDEKGESRPTGNPVLHGTITYVHRQFDGMLVEGSHAKTMSKPDGELVAMDVQWPEFRLHPQMTSFKVRQQDAVEKEIVKTLDKRFNGRAVNVNQAVVLRPVEYEGTVVYVPSMRVAASARLVEEDSAGQVFYVDLDDEKLQYKELEIEPLSKAVALPAGDPR
jgi:hypothetical protein